MGCLARVLLRPGKPVGEDFVLPRGLSHGEGYVHHVVSALRPWCTVPGPVKRDECPAMIRRWKKAVAVEEQRVRRPVSREIRRGRLLLCARSDRLAAITAVLGCEHQLHLGRIEVAFRPAEIRALLDPQQLFSGKVLALSRGVELGPVLRELVPSMLGGIDLACCVHRDADSVPDASRVSLLRREMLPGLVRVVAPDAPAGLQLGAWIVSRRERDPILELAGIRRGAKVHIHAPARVHREGMHGVVAGERQAVDDHLRRRGRRQSFRAPPRIAGSCHSTRRTARPGTARSRCRHGRRSRRCPRTGQ